MVSPDALQSPCVVAVIPRTNRSAMAHTKPPVSRTNSKRVTFLLRRRASSKPAPIRRNLRLNLAPEERFLGWMFRKGSE